MFYIFLTCLIALILTACAPTEESIPSTVSSRHTIEVTYSDVHIRLNKQAGWFAYPEATHLILAESANPMGAGGELDGMVMNIWTQMSNTTESMNTRVTNIVRDLAIRRAMATTMPRAFMWDGKEATYYMFNSGDGNVTVVIVLAVDINTPHIVGINISAPLEKLAHLRTQLPLLLDELSINNDVLTGASLDEVLPMTLNVPIYRPNIVATVEASPEPIATEAR